MLHFLILCLSVAGCDLMHVQDHVRRACKPQFTDVRRDPDGNVVGDGMSAAHTPSVVQVSLFAIS